MTITRSDLEAKLREIQGLVDETKGSARDAAVIGAVAVVILVALAFYFGRKRGGKTSKARIEIRQL